MTTESIKTVGGSKGVEAVKKSFYDTNGRGIPFEDVNVLFSYLPYATHLSIAIKLLHYTGCRIQEIDLMTREGITDNAIYWVIGKNQRGYRREYLPDSFIAELEKYWRITSVRGDSVLGIKASNILSQFNKKIRPLLPEQWQAKISKPKINPMRKTFDWSYEYVYQLKGFRKNWATLCFWYHYKKFQSGELAVQLTSARMKHSHTGMTSTHYLVACEQLNVERYAHLFIFEIVKGVEQKRICDYN